MGIIGSYAARRGLAYLFSAIILLLGQEIAGSMRIMRMNPLSQC